MELISFVTNLSSFQVAGGHVSMALGGDQGGSIRVPAAMCGIVGLKPTFGLVPYTGICPAEYSIDHTGPMARNVHDVALLLEAGEPYLKGVLIMTETVTVTVTMTV